MGAVKENSFIKKVLDYLKDTSKELLVLSAKIIFDPHSLTKGMGFYTDYTRPYFLRQVVSLKKSQYFSFKNKKFYLNSKGRIKIIKDIINKKSGKKIKWDGKWRAIIFDIPELRRKDRSFLRRELKWIGFKELQRSVWVYPYDIEKELKVLLKLWEIDFKGDIRFILIQKINDTDLRNYFRLKRNG